MKKFSPFGNDLFGDQIVQATNSPLKQKFTFPPFSVLNSREGQWQERKVAWLSLGIQSETGRGGNLLKMSDTILEPDAEKRKRIQAARKSAPGGHSGSEKSAYTSFGKTFDTAGTIKQGDEVFTSTGTSVFDPVLCEVSYDWFCPAGGQIIDPFCGGSVRGIVAACMGYKYWGGDLRQEQIDANFEQGRRICPTNAPRWVCGDSNETLESAPLADFVFSCPPYFDLEVYSEDEKDLSNMSWEGFRDIYFSIIRKACARLKDNRFAAFVVGDVRDKNGHYRNFHFETVAAFAEAGLQLYNHAILINSVGTLALRVTRQFQAGRKLGKSHQDLLVFVKGDWKKAASAVNNPVPPRLLAPPPRKKN